MGKLKQFLRGAFGCTFGLHRFHYNTLWDGTQEVSLAHCEVCCQARAFWPEGYRKEASNAE